MDPQQAFAELGTIVVGTAPLVEVLTRTAELALACVPGTEEVSVTLVENDRPWTIAFSGGLAASLDERQYEDGFGPCIHAAQTEQIVRIDDTGNEDVYRDLAAAAARQGVRSIVSVGMPMPQKIAGGMNVYRFDEGTLDDDAVGLLRVFAGYAAVALANHALYASAVALSENLVVAMQSREIIDMAKGVLIGVLRCTPDEAFAHMVRQSQDTNRKVRDIAAEVVERAAQA
ncbi:GAF and ANTAR domain-containing protein [Nakamurella flavida]|uniref:GAF and ANTAR domain-containing protein n=1 Tax=Nakamurella flavida TaxID=363630 RepID=A0A938YHQ0_9ACTN|nr:GAF and ANTAR domain-containing protein [Nakamurella flavida]MBM9475299.1 GAF and ANTAR domain-containing protein [Nakamurella flavida]MDP9776873.1 GAF domain-containing protein [Nakamurella flavida]